jgi:hypothetical protein
MGDAGAAAPAAPPPSPTPGCRCRQRRRTASCGAAGGRRRLRGGRQRRGAAAAWAASADGGWAAPPGARAPCRALNHTPAPRSPRGSRVGTPCLPNPLPSPHRGRTSSPTRRPPRWPLAGGNRGAQWADEGGARPRGRHQRRAGAGQAAGKAAAAAAAAAARKAALTRELRSLRPPGRGLLTWVLRELYKVRAQHAQQDGGQEAGQQQHRDAGVDDAEPVDLIGGIGVGGWGVGAGGG